VKVDTNGDVPWTGPFYFHPMRYRSLLPLLLGLCSPDAMNAQDQAKYAEYVAEAFRLYEQKDYAASAARYSAAFEALGWKGYATDRYNAACSWALAGRPDSAFFHLYRVAEQMNYTNLGHITRDTDLTSLHADPRWLPLLEVVKSNKDRLEANFDKPLVALLDSIRNEDQALRMRIDEVEQRHGSDSQEMKDLWRSIEQKDSTNLIIITKLLDERGWLGADVVGVAGNSTLFLVIQHADLATQEKYLPMMRQAVKDGRARGADLALLEDRVAIRNGRRQIYGSQIGRFQDSGEYYLSALEDPDRVDERRAGVGLPPLSTYLANWNLTWDVEAYKKQLPQLDEQLKKNRH
jgi:hypothetical protein